MTRRTSIISNVTIACVLFIVSLAVFTTDLTHVYVTVSAPVSHGDRNRTNISLMVDARSGNVAEVLDILESSGIHATFFINGAWAMQNSGLVGRIHSAGHELGNGAYTTKNFRNLSVNNKRKEIQQNHLLINQLTGVSMDLFMPPAGSFDRNTLRVAQRENYISVMWSRNRLGNVQNGDLVLICPASAYDLSDMIDFYLTQGFSFIPVGKNIRP